MTADLRDVERVGGGRGVLFRANAQSHKLETAFLKAGIPYRLGRGVRFYERAEVKDLLAYLRVALNPLDAVSLERVVNVPARGIGQATLERLRTWSAEHGCTLFEGFRRLADSRRAADPSIASTFSRRARESVGGFVDVVDELRAAAATRPPSQLLDLAIRRTAYEPYLRAAKPRAGGPTGEERWKNVRALRAIAREYDEQPPGEGLAAFLADTTLMQEVDTLDPEADAVPLLTMHSAKGLEFPVVFIVGMDAGIFPRTEGRHSPEEERRLFYVALTRAMRVVVLSGPPGGHGNPARAVRALTVRTGDPTPSDPAHPGGRGGRGLLAGAGPGLRGLVAGWSLPVKRGWR